MREHAKELRKLAHSEQSFLSVNTNPHTHTRGGLKPLRNENAFPKSSEISPERTEYLFLPFLLVRPNQVSQHQVTFPLVPDLETWGNYRLGLLTCLLAQ